MCFFIAGGINQGFFEHGNSQRPLQGQGIFWNTEFHGKGTRKHTEKIHKFCARKRAQNLVFHAGDNEFLDDG